MACARASALGTAVSLLALLAAVVVFGGFGRSWADSSAVAALGQARRLADEKKSDPKIARVIQDFNANGTKGVISVKKGDLVYHYGKFDHKNNWTYVTQLLEGSKDKKAAYGESGYVPDWCLGSDVDEGKGAAKQDKKKETGRRLAVARRLEEGPKLATVVRDFKGNGTKGVLSVHSGEYVYHYGKFDHKNNWTYVTQMIPGTKEKGAKYGDSGYVPDWALGDDVPVGSKDEKSAKEEDEKSSKEEDEKSSKEENEKSAQKS